MRQSNSRDEFFFEATFLLLYIAKTVIIIAQTFQVCMCVSTMKMRRVTENPKVHAWSKLCFEKQIFIVCILCGFSVREAMTIDHLSLSPFTSHSFFGKTSGFNKQNMSLNRTDFFGISFQFNALQQKRKFPLKSHIFSLLCSHEFLCRLPSFVFVFYVYQNCVAPFLFLLFFSKNLFHSHSTIQKKSFIWHA